MDQVKDIVNKVMKDLSSGQPTTQNRIQKAWLASCDHKIKKHTAIAGFQKGDLIVNVDSPAWLFQMSLQKKKILSTMKKKIPELSNLRFRIGKVK